MEVDGCRALALRDKGRQLVFAGEELCLYQLDGGRKERVFRGHEGPVNSVCLSTDEQQILSGGQDRSVRLWDVTTGECLQTWEAHAEVTSVALTRDGRHALSGAGNWRNGRVVLWDLASGRPLRSFHGPDAHTPWTQSLCVSPDGEYGMWSMGNYKLGVWHLHSGEQVAVFGSPDGRFVEGEERSAIVQQSGGGIGPFDASGSLVRWVLAAAWSEDGRYALTGGRPLLILWEMPRGQLVKLLSHTEVSAVAVSADSRFAASGASNGQVKLWDLGKPGQGKGNLKVDTTPLDSMRHGTGSIRALDIAGDGQSVVSAGNDGALRQWILDWDS